MHNQAAILRLDSKVVGGTDEGGSDGSIDEDGSW